VVTIGVFDGVHKGHIKILNHLKELAKKVNGESVILTFWPHPKTVMQKKAKVVPLLSTLDEKKKLIEDIGIEHLIILPFTHEFSMLSYEEFIRDILFKGIKTKYLVIGHNHQFGKGRAGNFDKLNKFSKDLGFNIVKLEAQVIDDEQVSSTKIRKALKKGRLDIANKFLGYEYFFSGKVIKGFKLGRDIGFPTANIELLNPEKIIPKGGVYAVRVKFEKNIYFGMMNIGFKPTVNNQVDLKSIEVHIFKIDKDLYGKELIIFINKKIREEIKFQNIEKLKNQLKIDKNEVKKIFYI